MAGKASQRSSCLWHSKREAQPVESNSNSTVLRYMQEEEEDQEEPSPSGAAWCFTAVMAFMAMLLIRHMFELFDSEREVQPAPHEHPAEGGLSPEASAGMLLLWLTVRFLVILIPMYAVLRVMHTVRDQQVQDEADRDLDQELTALLWVSTPSSCFVVTALLSSQDGRSACAWLAGDVSMPGLVATEQFVRHHHFHKVMRMHVLLEHLHG